METTSPKRAAPGASPVGSTLPLGSTGTPSPAINSPAQSSVRATGKLDTLSERERDELNKSGFRPTLREQLRSNLEAIRERPYSHALVALATIIGWTVVLVLPLVLS